MNCRRRRRRRRHMFANFRCPLEAVRLGRVYTFTNTFSHALPTRSSYSTCSRLICPLSCALSSSLAFHWQHAFAHARQTFVLSAAGASEDYKQFLYQNETNCGNLSDLPLPLLLSVPLCILFSLQMTFYPSPNRDVICNVAYFEASRL